MYTDYYGLKEKPFTIEPNPRFMVLTEGHREALATLLYAIEHQEGWALVAGDPGVGKTNLLLALIRRLGDDIIAAVITNPHMKPLEFMNQAAMELGLDGPYNSKGEFLAALSEAIHQCRRDNKKILLIVDEAQALLPEMFEELRLMGNLDTSSPRVLNIFLIGQPEVILVMKEVGAKALMQRLHRKYALKPLNREETAYYVRERLRIAGAGYDIFDQTALAEIYANTGGVPRLINALADDALLLGFAKDKPNITQSMVAAAAKEQEVLGWSARDLGARLPEPLPSILPRPLNEPPEPRLATETAATAALPKSSDQSQDPPSDSATDHQQAALPPLPPLSLAEKAGTISGPAPHAQEVSKLKQKSQSQPLQDDGSAKKPEHLTQDQEESQDMAMQYVWEQTARRTSRRLRLVIALVLLAVLLGGFFLAKAFWSALEYKLVSPVTTEQKLAQHRQLSVETQLPLIVRTK